MESVKELVARIDKERTQTSASRQDELAVMTAMLNDPTYKVDVYAKDGVVGQYCPYEESRSIIASILKDTTKISSPEATELANGYEFNKTTSNIMIGLSKEYINTYLQTGRKLPLGGRKDSNISISRKIKGATTGGEIKVGVEGDGSDKTVTDTSITPPHGSIKVYSPCPSWLKK